MPAGLRNDWQDVLSNTNWGNTSASGVGLPGLGMTEEEEDAIANVGNVSSSTYGGSGGVSAPGPVSSPAVEDTSPSASEHSSSYAIDQLSTTGSGAGESAGSGSGLEEQFGALSDKYGEEGDKFWGQFWDEMGKAEGNIDESLKLKLDAAGDSRAQAQRRGIEMGAMQGGSGFGGMQAGKDLQAQLFGDQLANQAYQAALDSKLGLRKGAMNALLGRATDSYAAMRDADFDGITVPLSARQHDAALQIQGLDMLINMGDLGGMDSDTFSDLLQGIFPDFDMSEYRNDNEDDQFSSPIYDG